MSDEASAPVPEQAPHSARLALLLAAAMFVLVVDTSLMNVSISAVVEDLDTTVSGVQSAIALEALVSAAFILISSKVGDLIGRKRAYVLGLLAYAIGAAAMTLAQSLTAIIIFWAHRGRPRCVAAAARHAVPHPRELRRRRPEEDLRPGGGRGRDRRRGRAAARRVRHDVPVVAGRVRPRGRGHRGGARQHQAGPRRGLHRTPPHRPGRRGSLRRGHGRCRPGDPGLAGGRRIRGGAHRGRCRRARRAGVLAGAPQAPGEADAARPGPVPLPALPARGHPADCSSRSPWAAR